MSTCTLASFSYLCTPAAAIFQNSLALLVTNASFSALGSDALMIFAADAFPPPASPPPPLAAGLLSSLLHELAESKTALTTAAPTQFQIRMGFSSDKCESSRLAMRRRICERSVNFRQSPAM